ncbi:MAG: T9SS type A sorting domain-containing protein [Chitinophagales bacterium]
MIKFLINCLFICSSVLLFANDTIDINLTTSSTPYPNKFTGVSSMSMYECVDSTFNNANQTIQTNIFDTIYNLIKPLNLKVFRFPGGTIGNYYHFYGNGHGIDTSETTCAPGRVGNVDFANMHLAIDKRMDKNIIEYFREEIDTLKKYGDGIGVCFRVNSHTHFYKGDLKQYSDSIQYLIYKYVNADTSILNTNGNNLDSNKINTIVNQLMQLQNDAIYKRIKNKLVADTGFNRRFKENMDAAAYLLQHGISILGAEIGNETYAEYVVFDDDLSFLGFDCTQAPDSFHYDLWQLPLRYYLEGMIKNNLLVGLYADSLKTKFNIYSAVPANNGYNYLTLDANYQPVHVKPYDITVKKSDLWNKYFASQTNVFAMIPHIYSQNFMSCSDFMNVDSIYGINKQTANQIALRFYKYFIDTLLDYNLKRFHFYSNNKPLWITEWNFSDASYATNTFIHAFYDYYFIRKMLDINDVAPNYVQILLYHHLTGGSYGWPIIRTYLNSVNHQFVSQKQTTYYPFYLWSNTMAQQVKRIKTPFWQNIPNTIVDVFKENSNKKIIVQYINSDSVAHFIALNQTKFVDQNEEYVADSVTSYIFDAESLLSTNFSTCTYYNNTNFSTGFQELTDTVSHQDTLWLPAYSMGKFNISLKNDIQTNIKKTGSNFQFNIFPNPTKNTITLQLLNSKFLHFPYTYNIINEVGNIVLNGKILASNTQIDVSKLASGWYHIYLENKLKEASNKAFIKH